MNELPIMQAVVEAHGEVYADPDQGPAMRLFLLGDLVETKGDLRFMIQLGWLVEEIEITDSTGHDVLLEQIWIGQ